MRLRVHTSEIPNEIAEFHFAFSLDALVVQVGVEHDYGEGEEENGIELTKLFHHFDVAFAVAIRKRLSNHPVYKINDKTSSEFHAIHLASTNSKKTQTDHLITSSTLDM